MDELMKGMLWAVCASTLMVATILALFIYPMIIIYVVLGFTWGIMLSSFVKEICL